MLAVELGEFQVKLFGPDVVFVTLPTFDVLIACPITDGVPEGADLEVALERRA